MTLIALPLPAAPSDDHGGLTLYRLWHPNSLTPRANSLRTWGPAFRFDPHPLPCADHPDGPTVWYGAEALETAIRERFDRFEDRGDHRARLVTICRRSRASVVRLPAPTRLLDLTSHAAELGAPDDLGDAADTDYAVSWAWSRALHANEDYDGLRYWSARHRHPDSTRAGVNVALWRLPAGPLDIVSDVPFSNPGLFNRTAALLDQPHVNIGVVEVDSCAECLR